ncbi:MAG: valine--tRNA ligase [Piscirickettsiaceae bacterium]|nr:valine--tRNA ligase [Piscirickettsiaceae bacterium]
MDKKYNHHQIEQHWYQIWENNGQFKPSGSGSPYAIMLPPPNVTGSLHMGHAFNHTIMDTLTRYHRMKGYNTLWQPGTDHAGIATQMVVERQLNIEGKTRHDLGRNKFIDRIWDWKKASGDNIMRQLRRLGSSLDWSRDSFTMDEGLSEAVKHIFVQLHKEGLIYRDKRLVNWDPVLHTALSDLEVLSELESGHLWYFRYPLSNKSGHLVVSTTRPETILGDTGVAVHPEDKRYQNLIGETVTLPLVGREIPIIADSHVDQKFGTGCLKITPAHDFNDAKIGRIHNLEQINIFNIDAAINNNAPAKYRGLDRYEARNIIVNDFKKLGLLAGIKAHKLMVPRGDRSGVVIEPFLTNQWYVRVDLLAEPAIKAVQEGRIKFIPNNWNKTFYNWMDDIQDWCVSRQIWWGHRIPAWYDEEGNVYVAYNEAAVRQENNISEDVHLRQDEDVLDTWFSSALWPFSTLGWPNNTDALHTWYPSSVLVTGFDIIFFWVARMIMMGLHFMGDVPFREVYIHGLVRDSHGHKMSKSKGNGLDPIDIIDGIDLESLVKKRTTGLMSPKDSPKIQRHTRKEFPEGIQAYGTDALRFTFASLATTGRDINFDLRRIGGYRNFCNKLWNAARYVLINIERRDITIDGGGISLGLADRWIISRLQETKQNVTAAIDGYRFDHAAQYLYEFIWDNYCSWYLELSKVVLTNKNETETVKRGTRHTLVYVLESILRLTHPFMPFITEEIWQNIAPLAGKTGGSIMYQSYPIVNESEINKLVISEMEWIMAFIMGVRSIRSQINISPKKQLSVIVRNGHQKDIDSIETNYKFLIYLANLGSIRVLTSEAPISATALVGKMEILIPLEGLLDRKTEIQRLNREITKLEGAIKKSFKKLNNENYMLKAPELIVRKERDRLTEMELAFSQLRQQHLKLVDMDV